MNYELLMKEALRLAEHGFGTAHPNPLVGALIANDAGGSNCAGFSRESGEKIMQRLMHSKI